MSSRRPAISEVQAKRDRIYTVSEITRLVKQEIENTFPSLWVEGEVSNFHRHSSGHLYFTLKDERSQLRGVMFRGEARRLAFDLKDGLQVICRGRLNVYEPRGEYQIVVERVEPKGKGALQLAFEQLKERLRAEGLFDPQHKKPLPLFPKKLGVVTSPRGAAIIDILRTLERRFARLQILIYPARVQGDGAAEEIVEGIEYLGGRPDIDVLIVGRGGGSIEDLWAFNEEKVARAIFRCPIPVISAVGHEVDVSIADFVADIRASTPSVAAELVIKEEQALVDRIDTCEKQLNKDMLYSLQERRQIVSDLSHHRVFQYFQRTLYNLEQRVDELEERTKEVFRRKKMALAENRSSLNLFEEKMASTVLRLLQSLTARWEKLSLELHNLSPLNILKKGYTLCWKGDLQLIRRVEDVETDEDVTVSFYRGAFTCRVREIDSKTRLEDRLAKEKS